MNHTEPFNQPKCYICDEQIAINPKNVFSQVSRYTGTPVYGILQKFMGDNIIRKRPDHSILCQSCLDKIDEYDLAIVTAERVETELRQLFVSTIQKYTIDEDDFKPTPSTMCMKKELTDDGNTPVEAIRLEESGDNYSQYTPSQKTQDGGTITQNQSFLDSPKLRTKQRARNCRQDQHHERKYDECFRRTPIMKKKKRKHLKPCIEEYFYCDKCTAKFETKLELKTHIKTHDSFEKQVCDICGQTYKSKAALDIHVGLHQGKSPHECEMCGKHFTQKGALVRHMPIHTGERPYQCDKCGKQFIHYSSFHMHQLAHDNIRDKKCTVCGLELRSNSHLTRHMRVHSGEKPYACPTCGQKFAQRYNMMTHFKAHQGIHRVSAKTHICPICNAAFPKSHKLNEHMAIQHNTYNPTTSEFHPNFSKQMAGELPTIHMDQDVNGSIIMPASQSANIAVQNKHLVDTPCNDSKIIDNGGGSGVCVTLPVSAINIPITNFLLPNAEVLQIKKETFLENM